MDYNVPSIMVVALGSQTALPVSTRATDTLTTQEFGIFDSKTFKSVTAPSFPTNQSIFIAQGSGRSEIGSFKSANIYPKNITSWRGVKAICTNTQQITYVGFNGVDDCYTMSAACDEKYSVTIRVFGERVRHLNPQGLTKSYLLQTACCEDCTTNCDDVNCDTLADSLVAQVNADPYMNKWVLAEKVTKCTDPGTPNTFSLLVPCDAINGATGTFTDAAGVINAVTLVLGGSGYITAPTVTAAAGSDAEITATVIDGEVTALTIVDGGTGYTAGNLIIQTPLEALYSAYGTIAVTADTDNCDNGTEEWILTPDSEDTLPTDLLPYKGVAWTWTPCTDTGATGCVCGVRFTAKALDAFGNECVPTAFPHTFDSVRFQVYTAKGEETTNDFDVYDPCTVWNVQTVQTSEYAIGSGVAYRDQELEKFSYYNKDKVQFINPLFNFNHTLFVDDSLYYDAYILTYKVEKDNAFTAIDPVEAELVVIFPHDCNTNTISTLAGIYQAAMNTLANAQGFPSVSL